MNLLSNRSCKFINISLLSFLSLSPYLFCESYEDKITVRNKAVFLSTTKSLDSGDFSLKVNGKKMNIKEVEIKQVFSERVEEGLIEVNEIQRKNKFLVLIFDDFISHHIFKLNSIDEILENIDILSREYYTAVFSIGLEPHQYCTFTKDKELLTESLEKVKRRSDHFILRSGVSGASFISKNANRIMAFLLIIINEIASVEGDKHIIYFSNGYLWDRISSKGCGNNMNPNMIDPKADSSYRMIKDGIIHLLDQNDIAFYFRENCLGGLANLFWEDLCSTVLSGYPQMWRDLLSLSNGLYLRRDDKLFRDTIYSYHVWFDTSKYEPGTKLHIQLYHKKELLKDYYSVVRE